MNKPKTFTFLCLVIILLMATIGYTQPSGQVGAVFNLEGDNEIPPVTTAASGRCTGTVNQEQNRFHLLCTHTVTDPTSAGVHFGDPMSNGPVVLDLGNPVSPIDVTGPVSPSVLTAVLSGNYYVNILSGSHPSGEVRGQIGGCNTNFGTAMCITDDRFKVEVSFSVSPSGPSRLATPVEVTSEAGYFYFFTPDNLETLVNVIDGCSTNNHFWVFAAAVTDLEFMLTITDTKTSTMRQYSNLFGMAFAPVADTTAFATCP